MSDEIQVSVRFEDNTAIIDLVGDVTTFAEEAINEAYQSVSVDGAETIIFNFRENDFINSSGIAIMITNVIIQARKRDQRLLFTGLSTHFQKIFRQVGLTQYGDVSASVEEALDSIDKKTKVSVRFKGHTAIIDVEGNLTVSAKQALNQAYQTATAKGTTNVVFNFRENDYILDSGIGILYGVVTEARKRGQRVLYTGLSVRSQKNSFWSSLLEYGDLYPSIDEALDSLNNETP